MVIIASSLPPVPASAAVSALELAFEDSALLLADVALTLVSPTAPPPPLRLAAVMAASPLEPPPHAESAAAARTARVKGRIRGENWLCSISNSD